MDDETSQPHFAARALDTATDVARTSAENSAARVDAIEQARLPHRPRGVLGAVTRQAPLSALLVAALLGIAIGRRHQAMVSLDGANGRLSNADLTPWLLSEAQPRWASMPGTNRQAARLLAGE